MKTLVQSLLSKKMNIPLGRYRFTSKILYIPIIIVMIAILVSLGNWQIHRAQEKRAILASLNQQKNEAVQSLNDLSPDESPKAFQKVRLTGGFDNQHVFLHDNQFHDHILGYHVLVPVKLSNTDQWVLVNRGFIARPAQYQELPKVQAIGGEQILKGIVNKPGKQLLLLGANEENPKTWPMVIERMDFNQMSQQSGHRLSPFTVVLDQDQAATLIYNWTPVIMSPERHLGYAFQWFALAATLAIAFVATHLKRD